MISLDLYLSKLIQATALRDYFSMKLFIAQKITRLNWCPFHFPDY